MKAENREILSQITLLIQKNTKKYKKSLTIKIKSATRHALKSTLVTN